MRRNRFIIKTEYFGNVSFMLFLYWAVLVLWQNISGTTAKSAGDVVVKIGLLLYFVVFYLLRAKRLYFKAGWALVLVLCLVIPFLGEADRSMNVMVSYIYPVLVLFMAYGLGDKLEINKKQLVAFCNSVILVVLYAAIYAVIFCADQFKAAFSIDYAYGNELSSFFVSNFEYGVYLMCGIVACMICMYFQPRATRFMKAFYAIAIAVFAVNIVLSFSRTTIFSMILFLLVYVVFSKNRKYKTAIIVLAVLTALAIAFIPELNRFVFDIVLKGNTMSGRDELGELAMKYFDKSTGLEKFFGHGISESRAFFEEATSHGSVHNAYLQVLVYYGLSGVAFVVIFLVMQIITCVKEMKKDRFIGVVSLGLVCAAALIMVTTTAIIFNSSIDSFFVTMFMILIPKYVRNSIQNNRFYTE